MRNYPLLASLQVFRHLLQRFLYPVQVVVHLFCTPLRLLGDPLRISPPGAPRAPAPRPRPPRPPPPGPSKSRLPPALPLPTSASCFVRTTLSRPGCIPSMGAGLTGGRSYGSGASLRLREGALVL